MFKEGLKNLRFSSVLSNMMPVQLLNKNLIDPFCADNLVLRDAQNR